MRTHFPRAFFVAGTDSGVGKTFVSSMLALGLQAGYWKPIQPGRKPCTDTQWMARVTGLDQRHFFEECYRFSQPLPPHAAAQYDDLVIDLAAFVVPDHLRLGHLIVEGTGGIMEPLNTQHLMLDLIQRLELPVLLVARTTPGTASHILLTLEQLRRKNIPTLGVVLNGLAVNGTRKDIENFGDVPVLSEIEPLEHICADTLLQHFNKSFGYGDDPAAGQDIPDLVPVYTARRALREPEYATCGAT